MAVGGFAQTTTAAFLQDISSSATLTTSESTTRTKILTDATISSYWVVQVNPIETYLTGKHLSFTLPGRSLPISFDADYVSSQTDGSYHWLGYAADGSIIDISKFSDGSYFGGIFNGYDNSRYQILSLSPGRCLLTKKTSGIYTNNDCATPGDLTNNSPEDDGTDNEIEDRTGCEVNLIRVLFLYTPAAAATGFNPSNVAFACINDLNAAAATSGIPLGSVSYHNAGVAAISFSESSLGNIFSDRASIIGNTTAQTLRSSYSADIVVLLTAPAYGTTIGFAKPDGGPNAFAVVVITGAAGPAIGAGFTATHEIGHLSNARHQKCLLAACQPAPSGCDDDTDYHGFVFTPPSTGVKVETVMAQSTCAAPKVLRWSNPNALFLGEPTGTKHQKDYRTIIKEASTLSCYMPAPTSGNPLFGLTINGNSTICSGSPFGYYSFAINPFGVAYPLTYSWEVSSTGTGSYTVVGTGANYVLTSISGLSNPFFLRLTVTDLGGKIISTQISVDIVNCLGGGDAEDRGDMNNGDLEKFRIYPNPTSGIINVLTTSQSTDFKITDAKGRVLYITPIFHDKYFSFDFSQLPSGIYYLHTTESSFSKTFKVVKI